MSLTRQRGTGPYFGMACGCACSNPPPLNTQSSGNVLEGIKRVIACVPADPAWATYFEICWPGSLAHSGVTSPGTTWDNNILPTSHPYVTNPDGGVSVYGLTGMSLLFTKSPGSGMTANSLLAQVDLYDPALLITVFDHPTILVQWSPVISATAYVVKRSTNISGPYTNIVSVGTTSYSDTGVYPGTYYYKVSAIVGGVESATSSGAMATVNIPDNPIGHTATIFPPAPPPGAVAGSPQNVTAFGYNPQVQLGYASIGSGQPNSDIILFPTATGFVASQNLTEMTSPQVYLCANLSTPTPTSSVSSLLQQASVVVIIGSLAFYQISAATAQAAVSCKSMGFLSGNLYDYLHQLAAQENFYFGPSGANVTALFPALTFPNGVNFGYHELLHQLKSGAAVTAI